MLKFAKKSGRVKSVDLHPTEPWILTSLFSGSVCIWDYKSQTMAKSFEVTKLPVRSAKFVARKQWVVAGADDMFIRVYNYNTMDKVEEYQAHTDYIRCVAVHPTLPYILSASDDMLIKLWDWEKSWYCTQVFEGHSNIVMQVTINPKDTNTFVSASTDSTTKVWNLCSPDHKRNLRMKDNRLNCVDYFTYGDKPYLVFGSDDHTAMVFKNPTTIYFNTLEGHTQRVTSVCFHPEMPIIITGSEDGTVCIWCSITYRLENTLNYGFGRVWAVGYMKGSRRIAIGYDEGTIMVKVMEMPVASMDNSGKITWAQQNGIQTWAQQNKIQTANIKSVGDDYEVSDGDRLPLAVKELGTCDLYPHSLKHSPDGMFVVVCGDGEYVVHTASAWGAKFFGLALEFVWSSDGEYAIRESTTNIKIFNKSFQEKKCIRPTFSTRHIYGGSLLAMCSNDYICFYDWAECRLIRRIDVCVKKLYWANSGDMLAITNDSSFYILRYNNDLVSGYLDSGRPVDEQGIKDSFKLLYEVSERVRTGLWVGDCFIYTNYSWRLNYCVGGEATIMFHLDRPMYLLGYLANQSKVYLIDKEFNVIGYTLPLAFIEYKTLVMRGDVARAINVLPLIPKEHHNSVACFLESRGLTEEALEFATDLDYRFELAIELGKLDIAKDIVVEAKIQSKWKQLVELAISLGDAEEIAKLTPIAKESGKDNVAFACLFMLGKFDECLQMLVDSNRMPEAALMARAYLPSKVLEIVALWRKDLNKNAADPKKYPDRYEDWQVALEVESRAAKTRDSYPVAEYVNYGDRSHVSLVEVFKYMQLDVEKSSEKRELDHEGIHHLRASSADRSNSPHGGKSQYPQSKEVDSQAVEENRKEGEFIDSQKSSSVKIEILSVQRTEVPEDLHPTKPWALIDFYEEEVVCIWNFQSCIKWRSFSDGSSAKCRGGSNPLGKAARKKFIVRKDWIVFAFQDGFIHVYECHSKRRITRFKAHKGWILSVGVHPTLPYILTSSCDMVIKLWDWNSDWKCKQTFQEHSYYVDNLVFSPRDANIFAGIVDGHSIKIWNLGSSSPRLLIKCPHEYFSCLNFFDTGEKLYLVTGSADHTAKVWDYETGNCISTLECHTGWVTSVVCINSNVNLIITGSSDENVRVWNATTYELEHVFTPKLGVIHTIGFIKDSSQVIVGCYNGIFVGRVIFARS